MAYYSRCLRQSLLVICYINKYICVESQLLANGEHSAIMLNVDVAETTHSAGNLEELNRTSLSTASV